MYQAKITEIIQETPNVKLFRLSFSELKNFSFHAGQFVMIGHPELKGDTGFLIQRAFSVASAPSQKKYLELCIKIVEGGKFSTLCERIRVGDTLEVKGPFGKFHLAEKKEQEYVFFAGGTGIAPLMSMLREFKHQRFPQKVTLFFTFREPEDFIYQKELENMAMTYPHFTLLPTCTSQQPKNWQGTKGRFTIEHMKEHIAFPSIQHYYLCGNNDFVKDIKSYLAALDVPKDNIKTEAWG